jgi:hypothetical protein
MSYLVYTVVSFGVLEAACTLATLLQSHNQSFLGKIRLNIRHRGQESTTIDLANLP